MDKEARCSVALKLLIDGAAVLLMLWSLEVNCMVYMKDYHFSWQSVLYSFDFHGMDGYSELSFSKFADKKCTVTTPDSVLSFVCDALTEAKIAGVAYLIVSCVVTLLIIYNALNTVGLVLYFNCCGLLKRKEPHYAVAPLYGFGVLLYVLISRMFVLKAPANFSEEFASWPEEGFFIMCSALLTHAISVCYFIYIGTDVAKLEAAVNPGMQRLVQGHMNVVTN